MKIFTRIVAFIFAISQLISCQNNAGTDYTKWVDPFIGPANHGHTFPGATTPFGMVQLSPDNGVAAGIGAQATIILTPLWLDFHTSTSVEPVLVI